MPQVRESFRVAKEEKPGPTHLELPEDIAALAVPKEDKICLYPVSDARRPIADEKEIQETVRLIQAAKRPLLVLGAGANRRSVRKQVQAFVEKYGVYAVSTQMGKGVLSERHPQYIGCAALSDNDLCVPNLKTPLIQSAL